MMEQNLKKVEMKTAGIIPQQTQVPGGNIVLYDLADHHQYYSSHSSCLETISLKSPSTFLLLSDLSKGIDVMKSEYNYWCSLIGNAKAEQKWCSLIGNIRKAKAEQKWCSLIGNIRKAKAEQKSSIILVVGTHADKIDPEELSFIWGSARENWAYICDF